MADLYTTLQFSPRKKRYPSSDDENTSTPKRLRLAPPTPPVSVSRQQPTSPSKQPLPSSLNRLSNLQNALQHALSHALATCALSPTSDTGHVKNVLNHFSLTTYSGFSSSFDVSDLLKLCWVWEWDPSLPIDERSKDKGKDADASANDDDNPFLDQPAAPVSSSPSDWTRGGMGFIISSATHYSKSDRKRIPAYGIGIEVEMDIDKDMGGGMAAVARWTANAESRRKEFAQKLERWIELHADADELPVIPQADLPELAAPKVSALTRTLASCSPSAIPASKLPVPPSSPSRSPTKRPNRDFAIPFPLSTPSRSSSPIKKSNILFPQTPSRHLTRLPPTTPSTRTLSPSKDSPALSATEEPPDSAAPSPAQTPSRRQALYERIRQRSLSQSPTKRPADLAEDGTRLTRDQMLKMSQDAIRRRCLLGRLPGVAESIWMLFSNPSTNSVGTPSSRKRRALPVTDIVNAVIKSSPVPISTAEANESLTMLMDLCPFFLRKLDISGQAWVEMPATTTTPGPSSNTPGPSGVEATPTKPKPARQLQAPPSPHVKGKEESAQELLTRSPMRVKRDGGGGLREVREIIRRELDLEAD